MDDTLKDEIEVEFRCTGAEGMFDDFVAVGDNIPTCEPQSVAEIVDEIKGDEAHSPENHDEDDCVRLPATFVEALAGLDALCSFFRAKDNENAEMALQCVENELLLSKGRIPAPAENYRKSPLIRIPWGFKENPNSTKFELMKVREKNR